MLFIFTFLQIQSASRTESKSDDKNVETGQKMNAVCDNKLQPFLECTKGEEQVMDIANDYSINCEENAQNGKLIHDAMTKLGQKLQSHVRNGYDVSLPDNKDTDWVIFWRDISSQYIYSYSFHNNASTKPKFALKEATESISASLFDFLMANQNFDVEQYVKTQSDTLYDLVCKPDLQDFVETKELELVVSQYLDNLTNTLNLSNLPNKLSRRQSNRDWRKATSETNDRNNIFGCYPGDFACNIV